MSHRITKGSNDLTRQDIVRLIALTPMAEGDKGPTFQGCRLVGIDLSYLDLSNASFYECDLRAAIFRHAYCDGTTFAYANLEGADFTRSGPENAHFTGANLRRSKFVDAHASHSEFEGADFTGADLTHVTLSGAHCLDTNFTRAKLINASMGECKLVDCKWDGVVVKGGDWRLARYQDRAGVSVTLPFEVPQYGPRPVAGTRAA